MAQPYGSLVELLDASARAHAQKPLFGSKIGGAWRWITYDEFRKDVDRFQSALAQLGVGRGDRVGIVGQNSVEWAITAYAAATRGAAFVPLYEEQGPAEWEYILRDAAPRVVVAANRATHDQLVTLRPRLPSVECVLGIGLADTDPASFRSHLVRGGANPAAGVLPRPEDLATILYTSGTTGVPKGVELTHQNLCSNVAALTGLFPYGPDERSLAFLPWAHSFGQTAELHALLSIGASLAINDAPDRLLENLEKVRPTVLYAVPRVFHRIHDGVAQDLRAVPAALRAVYETGLAAAARRARGESLGLPGRAALAAADRLVFSRIRARLGGRLRWVVSGSAALPLHIAALIDAIGVPVYEGYGLTETSPVATTNRPGARRLGTVGQAIPGVRIELLAAAEPTDGSGEIVVHGPNVMRGYHGLPDETARVLTAEGGLRTGDLGRLDAEGYLTITGRLKELYKLENGRYVAPAPLEDALRASPYFANVMLHGENRPWNVAILVLNDAAVRAWAADAGLSIGELATDDHVQALVDRELRRLSEPFKAFERPEGFVIAREPFTVENGTLTPTLKVKRSRVVERYRAELDRVYASR
ncbi:MAG: long-chain fatty acid--CoA ligase [Deltaproteobacteria bacterium]|nr:long-chain fatty acid--CoA ligase [Deltaproteobacteria bacterium]